MSAPIPTLPPDFDQRLMRELRPDSPSLVRYRRILLTGYGLISVVTCAVVMRGQGFGWGGIAVLTLGPLALLPISHKLWGKLQLAAGFSPHC